MYGGNQPKRLWSSLSAGHPEGGQFTRQSDSPVSIPVKVQASRLEVVPIKHKSGKTTSCLGSGRVVLAPKAYFDWEKVIKKSGIRGAGWIAVSDCHG